MKVGTVAIAVAVAAIAAVALAVHFELSARARVYGELRGLRAETTTDLDRRRISPAEAAALERQLSRVRRQIKEDDVRQAQKLLDGVKADLKSRARPA